MKVDIPRRAANPQEISLMFGIPEGSLANLRWKKEGPKYYRRKRRIYYFISDVEDWLKQNPILTKDSLPEQKD